MSTEFRQRTISEYINILWRRKLLIILPTIAVFAAVSWVVWKLPNLFESASLLIFKQSVITTAAMQPMSEQDLTSRILNIEQEVASRSSLQPLIEKYNLYAQERQRGEPMEALIERMRKDMRFEIDNTRTEEPNAFTILFKYRDNTTARNVTQELASKYVNAQASQASREGSMTRQFYDDQLRQAKEKLDEIDARRVQAMQANQDNLPTQTPSLVAQLAGLREQQKTLTTETGRLRDLIAQDTARLSDVSKQREQELENFIDSIATPESTPAWAELVKRRSELEAELQRMKTTLRDRNPDVIEKQAQYNSVQREMEAQQTTYKAKIEERRKRLQAQIDPRVKAVEYNLQTNQSEYKRQQAQLAQTDGQIAAVEARLNQIPKAEVVLNAIDNEYKSQRELYDKLLGQKQTSDMQTDIAASQQGATIQVIDPANLPTKPVAPNRPLLMAIGLALGLGLGLLFAALIEVPKLLTVQTTEDAEHYTNLPVLVAVPSLLTVKERRRDFMRGWALRAAGVLLAVLSIPALAYALKLSHVFEILGNRG